MIESYAPQGGTLRLAQSLDKRRNSFKTCFGFDMNGVLVKTLSTVASHDWKLRVSGGYPQASLTFR